MAVKKNGLYEALSKIDYVTVAFIALFLTSLQPLYGIFVVVSDEADLVALFFAKSVLIRFVGICGLIAAVFNAYCRSVEYGLDYIKKKFLSNPWNLLLLAFLLWSVVCTFTAKNGYTAFFGFAYRYEGLISYFGYAGIYMCASMLSDEKKRGTVMDIAIAVSALVALATIIQESDPAISILERSDMVTAYSGTFINSNHYGYYICVMLMLCAGRFMDIKNLFGRLAMMAAFALNTFVLAYNDSFGPALAVTVGLIVVFILLTVRNGIKLSWQYLLICVLFGFMMTTLNEGSYITSAKETFSELRRLIAVIFGGTSGTEVQSEAASAGQGLFASFHGHIFTLDEAADSLEEEIGEFGTARMKKWLAAIQLWKENPIFGVGVDNSCYEMSYIIYEYDMIHNEYLQILSETGTPGILFYLSSHVTLFARNIKKLKELSPAAFTAYCAAGVYMISAFFGISMPTTEVFFFFCLGLCNSFHTDSLLHDMLPTKAAVYTAAKK